MPYYCRLCFADVVDGVVFAHNGPYGTWLMPKTHAPETVVRNRRQQIGVGFWRRFFTPVAKFLAPETNTNE